MRFKGRYRPLKWNGMKWTVNTFIWRLVRNLQGNQRLQGTNECSSVGFVSEPELYSFVKKTDSIGKIHGTFIFSLSQVF